MQKLLGLFSGRYLRGSQNIHMAKQLKPIEGHIAQIKDADKNSEDEVSHPKTTRYEPMIESNGFEEAYKTTLNSV